MPQKKIINEFTTVNNVKLFGNATTSTNVRKDTKKCKRFSNRDNCRFKHDCAFSHHDSIEN